LTFYYFKSKIEKEKKNVIVCLLCIFEGEE